MGWTCRWAGRGGAALRRSQAPGRRRRQAAAAGRGRARCARLLAGPTRPRPPARPVSSPLQTINVPNPRVEAEEHYYNVSPATEC